MGWLEGGKLPRRTRMECPPTACDEEMDAVLLVNGEINLDELADRVRQREKMKSRVQPNPE